MVELTKSKNFTEEYCCSVVKVGTLEDVPNSDNLKRTRINGESIVVNKMDVQEGDVMLYVSNECQISDWFLSANNLYRHYINNMNRGEVEAKLNQEPDFLSTSEGKKYVGYFEDTGRVRMIKLRGCPSFGVLFKPDALVKALMVKGCVDGLSIDWTQLIGIDFDQIEVKHTSIMGDLKMSGCDETLLFVKPYVPKRNTSRYGHGHGMKGTARWDRLDRMVPGQFKLHYDTAPLKKHLAEFRPSMRITATVKLHGTSFICGNVLTNTPLRFFKLRRWVNNLFGRELIKESRQEYGMVVSSRKVIKNEWADTQHPEGYYGVDIWTEYANIIFPYIPKGYTVYGEICGYLTGDSKMIQKDYDYGCRPGENFLMPYRVTKNVGGKVQELSIEEVGLFTAQMKAAMHDCEGYNAQVARLCDIRHVRVYEGTIANLLGYSRTTVRAMPADAMEALPDALANICNIEEREQLCTSHNVPREGIVIRIEDDEIPEAFKLKSLRFLEREQKAIDKGEVDIEMQDNNQ